MTKVTRYSRQPASRLVEAARAMSSTGVMDASLIRVHGWHAGDLTSRMDELDRQHGDDRAVMLDPDFGERLQPPEFKRAGRRADRVGRFETSFVRSFLLAFRSDDAGTLFADRFGFLGDRALHLLWNVDVLDLDRVDLDAPFQRCGATTSSCMRLLIASRSLSI